MTDVITLSRILQENHTIAVVGISAKWVRPGIDVFIYGTSHHFS